MGRVIKKGLSYDDVLLIPNKTPVESRKDIDTSTNFSKNIRLSIPVVSSNMDTVTESKMAITMAREGGIGIIHRFLPIEDQVEEVLKVKRSEGIIIENPYTLKENQKLKDAIELMVRYDINGILILNDSGILSGILTSRDILFEKNYEVLIKDIMTKDLVVANQNISIDDAKEILRKNKIEKLPLIQNNKLTGLITTKDIINREKFPLASKDKKGKLLVAASIGIKDDFLERTEKLLGAGADALVIDVAHGHSNKVISVIKTIKKQFGNVELVAGNVATEEGFEDLASAGADSIRVGVGPGSICSTRIVTGSGVPQLTALMDCYDISKRSGVSILADGGIKRSGDITKALAAGASAVMVGSLFGGTEESPGKFIIQDGKRFKVYRGMASFGAAAGRKQRDNNKDHLDINDFVAEGVETLTPYRGKVSEVLSQLIGGLRSGMSYCGARNVEELREKARFIEITNQGLNESKPHILSR